MPTPIVYGDYCYTCGNNGVFSCYHATTGKRVYQRRLRMKGLTSFTGSPVASDGHIYLTSEAGDVSVTSEDEPASELQVNQQSSVGIKQISSNSHCYTQHTAWNSDGRGNAVYLDRHNVACRWGFSLKKFRLLRAGSKLSYEFECCKTHTSTCRWVYNSFSDDGNGNAVYLDRQPVSCNRDELLGSFQLQRNSHHNKWRYQRLCCKKGYLTCYNKDTRFNDDGKGKVYYLDRHNVDCGHNYFLQYFTLQRNYKHNQIKYTMRCCA